MSITTKRGDTGQTGLMFAKRTSKDNPRICACGDVDELNSVIGIVKDHLPDTIINKQLEIIQKTLINLMGEIATQPEDITKYEQSSFTKLTKINIEQLEKWITEIESQITPITDWVIPGKNIPSAQLDFSRTVCRRAERSLVSLSDKTTNKPAHQIVYLNRLSDLLWLMARSLEQTNTQKEIA